MTIPMARKKKAAATAPVSSSSITEPGNNAATRNANNGLSAEAGCAAALKEFESADR